MTRGIYCHLATADNPGAVAMIHLHGQGAASLLARLTGRTSLPADGRLRLVDFAGIDHGLVWIKNPTWAQLMPHGGPRVVRRIIDELINCGATYEDRPDAVSIYPEANSAFEADMLWTLAHAASPAAVDLLLRQRDVWQQWLDHLPSDARQATAMCDHVLEYSPTLDRLVQPPSVVVVGKPNVGKSTLTNRLLGQAASIVADLPGTTRDWVGGLAEIGPIAVRWMDTPGLRRSDDAIEQQAIEIARDVARDADLLIAMTDCQTAWPGENDLPRSADMWVVNKVDQQNDAPPEVDADGRSQAKAFRISAHTGQGMDVFENAIVGRLGLSSPSGDQAWAFSVALRELIVRRDLAGVRKYLDQR